MHPSMKKIVLAGLALALIAGPGLATHHTDQRQKFERAHSLFQQGRKLQRLHRNTTDSRDKLLAAYREYRAALEADPNGELAARALYMSGSTKLFLDEPKAAIGIYAELADRYPNDRYYVAKALLKKAAVEKNELETDAARQTMARYHKEFPNGGPEKLRKETQRIERSLRVIGTKAPPMAASRWFNGEDQDRSGPTLVYFWATWCPNCKKEVPYINDLWGRYRDTSLRLVGVTNNTRGQTDQAVESYIQTNAFRFPIAIDADGHTSRAFSAASVPTAAIVDGSGVVLWHDHPAALSDGVIDRVLDARRAGGA